MTNNKNSAYYDLIKQWNDEQNESSFEQLAALRKQMESTGVLKKGEWVKYLAILTMEISKR